MIIFIIQSWEEIEKAAKQQKMEKEIEKQTSREKFANVITGKTWAIMFTWKILELTNLDKKPKNIWKLETEEKKITKEKEVPKKKVKICDEDDTLDTDADDGVDDMAERMAKLFLRL